MSRPPRTRRVVTCFSRARKPLLRSRVSIVKNEPYIGYNVFYFTVFIVIILKKNDEKGLLQKTCLPDTSEELMTEFNIIPRSRSEAFTVKASALILKICLGPTSHRESQRFDARSESGQLPMQVSKEMLSSWRKARVTILIRFSWTFSYHNYVITDRILHSDE